MAERVTQRVQCRCGHKYHIGDVKVFARYTDATVWNCEKCGAVSDDRPWVIQPYKPIPEDDGPYIRSMCGRYAMVRFIP